MKVDFNLNKKHNYSSNINFNGYKPIKNNYGQREYEFNYVYNSDQKDCYVEIFLIDYDSNGNFIVTGDRDEHGNIIPLLNYETGSFQYKLNEGKGTKINLASDYGISENQAFAYHYVLRPKNNPYGTPEYKIDPGNIINDAHDANSSHKIYNVVSSNASTLAKGGAMKLILPDINNVLWTYDKDNNIVKNPDIERARKTSKNIFNKIGGSLAGIEKDLEAGKLDNFTRIITTPLFTDDSLSSHAYWNKNCMQMAHSLGNINNYSSLQRKLFAKGMNLVSDGAYVNEGLEGVHFKHVLKWGRKSPYFNWFRISGLQDSPLSMGVFGKKLDNVSHRLVNSKYTFEQKSDGSIHVKKNHKYDADKPTYIQIFDNRLVDFEHLKEDELLKAYDKLPSSNLDINNHNDSVIPYSFVIDSDIYRKNAILLGKYNQSHKNSQIDLLSGEGTRAVAQFKYFNLDGKFESGFETWDANPDIAKLNYVPSNNETQYSKNILDPLEKIEYKKMLERKTSEVQDYAVTSAKYWTKKTNDILLINIAQQLKNINGKNASDITNKIKSISDGTNLPKNLDINETIVKNVLNGRYELSKTDTEEKYDKAILQGIMNLPLDSVEVGDDIVSVLSSPFISKRASNPSQIGVSRYDLYKTGNPHLSEEYKRAYSKTDKFYETTLYNFAKNVLDNVNSNMPEYAKLKDEKGNTTALGEYVIPLLTAEIARFAIMKGVSSNIEMKYDKNSGEISYDYDKSKSTSLLSMNIIADSPEDEAISLINKLQSNINKIPQDDIEELTKALTKSIKGTSVESFELADMILSKTGAGLDWRIDATKDMADIDSLKSGKTSYEYTWNKIIDFWSKFTKGVKEYHPDAYIAAEVTDATDIYNKGRGYLSGSRFSDDKEGVRKLINEAGFTTIANYDYFSSGITQIFGKLFDYDGENSPDKGLMQGGTINSQLAQYYTKEPLESLLYSYTFAGNHDKCRTLEGYAVDMNMVYEDLTLHSNKDIRKRAYKILNAMPYDINPSQNEIDTYDYSRVSNLAIAKCESIASGMGKAKEKIGLSNDKKEYVYNTMLQALKNLAQGKHKGKTVDAEGFGTKDFDTALDIVLEEMDYISHNKLSENEKKLLKNKTFEYIVDPAISKLLGHLKFLVALNGNPTLFSGDDYGSTGYETTTKNIFLQNRNIIREDWADENSPVFKEFIKKHEKDIDKIFALRNRPELEALNDGTPYILDIHGANFKKTVYSDFEGNIPHHDEYGTTSLSALLRQSPSGAMTISLFNTEGITHDFDQYYRPAEISLSSIGLGSGRADKASVIHGLKNGTTFYDVREINKKENERTKYKVENNVIKREDGQNIEFKDSVFILYKPAEISFTGRKVLYNPQYNFVSNPYKSSPEKISAKTLNIIAT